MAEKFYITTPIYYVNDKPHLGHAYTTILADVLARYHRLLGEATFFLTGTDEHGQKVERAARAAGLTPQQHADAMVVRFQELWARLGITNDDFIRTTQERHRVIVQEILQELYDRGEIYRDEYDGWYCVTCERFYTEKDLIEGRCPEPGCRRPVERIKEANYFFRMSRYQDWLIQYLHEHPEFIRPAFRRNETLGFLRKKLNDLCISRPKSRLTWGIELPFDRDYVCYVWFDALVNYISAVGYRRDPERFARWWPADVHLIGKDILTTHTVYWPTMLKAMGLPLPRTVFAHGWWLVGESKMSKSAGNVINPMELVDRYGVDAFRYYLLAEMPLGQDASFTEEGFVRRYNTDLANDLGNLLNRVVQMVRSYCGGRVPAPAADAWEGREEAELWKAAQRAVTEVQRALAEMRLEMGLAEVLAAVRATNRYLEQKQPWTLAKEGLRGAFETTLYVACEALRVVSSLLYPVMPEKMGVLREALGLPRAPGDFSELRERGKVAPGAEVRDAGPLFPRVDAAEPSVSAPAAPAGRKEDSVSGQSAAEISYEEFAKLDLRTAKVLEAERVPGTDKLLRLQILLGEERRQIVAGIGQHYAPEDLLGRTIVVVANLKPAKIRGVESRGMLLAAVQGDLLKLVTVDGEAPSGVPVK